jgi:hypothetical protein
LQYSPRLLGNHATHATHANQPYDEAEQRPQGLAMQGRSPTFDDMLYSPNSGTTKFTPVTTRSTERDRHEGGEEMEMEIKSPKPVSADGSVKRMEELLAAAEKGAERSAGDEAAPTAEHDHETAKIDKFDSTEDAKPANLPYLVPMETHSSDDLEPENKTPVPASTKAKPDPESEFDADDEKPTPSSSVSRGKQRASTFQDPADQVEELMREWTVTK